MTDQILVIGAGAAGLMTARALSKAGMKVTIIEARDRAGGRVFTTHPQDFSMRIEAGAEFIHGDLPFTLRLLQEAGLKYHSAKGEIWSVRKKQLHQQQDFIEGHEILIKNLKALKQDISVKEFLDKNFAESKHEQLRSSITGYVEGYDLADPGKASAMELRNEWLREDETEQYRIENGYGTLIDYLKNQCEQQGCVFHFNCIARQIHWKENEVELKTADQKIYTSNKVVITVPLGVWQGRVSTMARIDFFPAITGKQQAASAMGFGEVIKVILEFNEPFWENQNIVGKRKMKNLGFLFSDAEIPTWWTQLPSHIPILTGWFGGPRVKPFIHLNDEGILQLVMDCLTKIFLVEHAVLIEKLKARSVFNWSADVFTGGGYSYSSLNSQEYKRILSAPVANTLFFAGEALAEGCESGTVEAAFSSGANVAGKILGKASK